MKKSFLAFLAIILLTGISCQKKADIEADKQAFKQAWAKLTKDWDMNIKAGEQIKNTNHYTEDAIRIDNGKIYSGKEGIGKLLRSYNETTTPLSAENKAEKILVSGDLATVNGSFLGSFIQKESGDTLHLKEAWVSICERQADGSWLMSFTMVTELKD